MHSGSPERQALQQAVAFIGAGNYLSRVLIPAFVSNGVRLIGIASSGGVSAAHFGRKFGFLRSTTDPDDLIDSPEAGIVVIGTRHDSHARLLIRALQAHKDVFIEKPLALTMEEIDRIAAAWDACGRDGKRPHVMVGFNRRFAPQIKKMKALLGGVREPKSYIVTVNAGAISQDHWTQDPKAGGGRIIGEGCHFVDLLRFLTGSPIEHARVQTLGRGNWISDDKVAITLAFADGSWGTIHYVANGHRAFPKERIEVFCAGRVLQLDNFRRLRGFGWPGFTKMNLWRQDKGQNACVSEFLKSVEDGTATPIRFEELLEVARVTVSLGEAARS
jgi:predicted dehydrogenase